MRSWKPQPSLGRWIGLALLVGMLIAAGASGMWLGQALIGPPESWQINLDLYWRALLFLAALLLAGVLAYRVASAFTLGYELDRNGLYILWLGNRAVVPLDQIQSVDVGVKARRLFWG